MGYSGGEVHDIMLMNFFGLTSDVHNEYFIAGDVYIGFQMQRQVH